MATEQAMIQALYGHAVWANNQILERAEKLTNDQLATPVEGGVGTVYETLVHMMASQLAWLRRFRGQDPIEPPSPPDLSSLRAAWRELDDDTIRYIASLSDDDLAEVIHYRSWYGWEGTASRWEAVLHQVVHQHQHRAEVAMILTQFGFSPGEIDIIDYLDASRGSEAS